jgi:hypothetical protein
MNCFYGFVGLSQYCGLPEPRSKAYVNDLPGISTEMVEKIKSGDQETFFEVWQSVEKQAAEDFKEDVLLLLEKKVSFAESQFTTKAPALDMGQSAILPAVGLRGVRIDLPEGEHVKLHLKGLYLHSDEATTSQVTVKDYFTGQVFKLLPVTLEGGQQYLEIDEYFGTAANKSLLIEIDSATITARMYTRYGKYQPWHSCNQCCYDYEPYFTGTIDGITTGQPIGIYPDAEIICSVESFICKHIHKFVSPIKHKIAERLLDYKLHSYKLNVFTATPRELTQSSMNKLNSRYKELLASQLNRIDLTNEGVCFECNPELIITTSYQMP